jgi:hypothetical protein
VKSENIFHGENSLSDFINRAVASGQRELAEILTGGEKNYFRFWARNPLLYCRSEKMVEYRLEMGTDPEYREADGMALRENATQNGYEGIVTFLDEFRRQDAE